MDSAHLSASDFALQISELLDRRRSAQARALLTQALLAHPDDVELLLQAARADAIDGKNGSARDTLLRVLQQVPHHFGARAFLLALFTDDGELVQAEQLALSLIAEYPQSPDLYAAYARVMLQALNFAKARALATEALRMDADNDTALRALALCDVIELPRGTDSAALRRLLADHPEDRHTLGLVVSALLNSGDHRSALRGARELMKAQPNDPHWLSLVQALSVQNHWSMLPLWPLQRWGWSASIALWLGGVVGVRALNGINPEAAFWLSCLIIGYVVYSWVWPPILKRWMLR
ncbi:MAG: tetratricopeptide repeat protein [Rhizobacter sp.]